MGSKARYLRNESMVVESLSLNGPGPTLDCNQFTESLMKYYLKRLLLLSTFLFAPLTLADGTVSKEVSDRILEVLGLPSANMSQSPVPGFIQVEGPRGPIYISEDTQYLFMGTLFGNQPGKGFVDLYAEAEKPRRKAAVESIPAKDQIVFPAEGETKAHIYVFTDVDCGYCRKLHAEVPELNANGIEVRYLAYTRELNNGRVMADARSGGTQGKTYKKMVSAWCADDRQSAMTNLKTRGDFTGEACDNHPVIEQFELGDSLGVNGTPAIVLADGTLQPGYVPAKQLIPMLGLEPQ